MCKERCLKRERREIIVLEPNKTAHSEIQQGNEEEMGTLN